MSSVLGAALTHAAQAGHFPGIYRRGKKLWRVHLDVATNTWEDVSSLRAAGHWIMVKLLEEGYEPNASR